ncbi:MAG TPA: bifunctional 5,10-methylene-tetrahydrofolate dehydrogenase/5,10-methylene-tetrahydrofolate cyclohydrolase, partial [Candidatus Atribacteria bacterium]|nr:bifunctional 5,10-methylene-tetrahydrofolate dehydrogenase/5,10-methylene-tetrahydrofolate cyclohydrolase [Candidatus Atribacteria bacterium]
MVKIIDGRKIAKEFNESLKVEVKEFIKKNKLIPKLAVVIIGEDPASLFYVKMINRACEKVSIGFEKYHLSENTSEKELLKL